jgi:hypothetical protein
MRQRALDPIRTKSLASILDREQREEVTHSAGAVGVAPRPQPADEADGAVEAETASAQLRPADEAAGADWASALAALVLAARASVLPVDMGLLPARPVDMAEVVPVVGPAAAAPAVAAPAVAAPAAVRAAAEAAAEAAAAAAAEEAAAAEAAAAAAEEEAAAEAEAEEAAATNPAWLAKKKAPSVRRRGCYFVLGMSEPFATAEYGSAGHSMHVRCVPRDQSASDSKPISHALLR